MDEQRMRGYLELVQSLLSCPSGQESAILQQHQDLLDKGLLQVMAQVAGVLRQQGQENNANWIEQMAKQLARSLGSKSIRLSEPVISDDLDRILQELSQLSDLRDMARRVALCRQALDLVSWQENEMLWAIFQGELGNSLSQNPEGDRAENIEDAIAAYQQSLQVMTRETMPVEWAQSTMNLASAYRNRIRGDHAENIEDAIAAYQASLLVRTRETMPVEWAQSIMNLAVAYRNRIRGDHAENIEDAIAAYQASLQVMTRENRPVEWAQSMMNLASAYSSRIRGDLSENVEVAIDAYQQSLQVRTRENAPVEWAQSMMNLANAYRNRIRGDRSENIEDAITAYQASLQVLTQEAMPAQWAMSMNNLAATYAKRIRGDRAENIEAAIRGYRQSLQVRTCTTMPVEWAQSMMNLANAYYCRVYGDRAENIEDAITAYQQSLQVITRETMPVLWATLMKNLATAYSSRIYGDRAENIETAIMTYRQLLQTITREAIPVLWAASINNLASAYTSRIRGDRAENIEAAITAYQQSLQVRTREAIPIEWAESMNNLANAYSFRIRGDRAENIEAAIDSYSQSLEIFAPDTHSNDCRRTARLLANLYVNADRWSEATIPYETALNAVEVLYQAALSKSSQEAELSETNDLYRRAAYAYAKVGNLTIAIATLEQGRARGLSETLQRDRTDLETIRRINPDLTERYQTAANAINQMESTERRINTASESPQYSQEDFRQQAIQARQALKDCLTDIRQIPGYEKFLALPTFDEIVATVQPEQPLVYLLSTPNGSLALILTTAGISELWLNDLTEPQLIDLLNNDWFRPYSAYKESPTNRQGWLKAIDDVTHQLWNRMMASLIGHLQQINLYKAILIPTGYLGYLPLHAAWTPDSTKLNGRRYACDDIQFTYAPNALSLNAARTVANKTSVTTLLAINEPYPVNAGNLPSSSAEAAKAISMFSGKGNWKLLQQEEATRMAVLEQLPQKNVVHFSCHGSADFGTPLNSGLLMANNEILTLRDLLDLKLQSLRLAILSACETGIPGTRLPDEVVSLPTGLLQAGAAGVVSSLWSAADLSTMLLLSRFYDMWRTENLDPPEALRQAQLWLRDCNGSALAPYLKNSHPDIAQTLEHAHDQHPFTHPFYWAAFSYVGV